MYIFQLLGVGAIVVAVRLDEEIDKHDDIMALFNLVQLGTFTLKELINAIIVAVIMCGVFAIVTSMIGGFGAFCTSRLLLILVSSGSYI
jgi:flagellar motor switch protein FliM